MDFDPHFSEQGRRLAWGQVVGVLRSRAHAIKSMKENPGFDAKPITGPVVITGVPRTGTTALHRLMAVDARFQGLQTWLLDYPMPRPPIETWSELPRVPPDRRRARGALRRRPESARRAPPGRRRSPRMLHDAAAQLHLQPLGVRRLVLADL